MHSKSRSARYRLAAFNKSFEARFQMTKLSHLSFLKLSYPPSHCLFLRSWHLRMRFITFLALTMNNTTGAIDWTGSFLISGAYETTFTCWCSIHSQIQCFINMLVLSSSFLFCHDFVSLYLLLIMSALDMDECYPSGLPIMGRNTRLV